MRVVFGAVVLVAIFSSSMCEGGRSAERVRAAQQRGRQFLQAASSMARDVVGSPIPPPVPLAKPVPVVVQDATDFDNFAELENLLNEHRALDECFYLAKTGKTIPETKKLHFVLIGRPAFLGIPLHAREQLDDMREKSGFKEIFSSDVIGHVDPSQKGVYFGVLLKLVVTANRQWENYNKDGQIQYEWELKGYSKKVTFKEAVEADSELVQEANSLKYMMLIQEITGKKMKYIKQCVNIYDGKTATHDMPASESVNIWEAIRKDKRKLLAWLSYRVHVFDINQMTMQGKMADRYQYRKQYDFQMNIPEDENAKPQDMKYRKMLDPKTNPEIFESIEGKFNMLHPPSDTLMGPRRERVRDQLKKKIKNIRSLEGEALKRFKMKSVEELQTYLKKPEVTEFDVLALAPFTGLTMTITDKNSPTGEPIPEIMNKLHHVITVACKGKYGGNLFHDNFNLVGDAFASYKFFKAVAKWQKMNAANQAKKGWPLVMVVPSHIGSVGPKVNKGMSDHIKMLAENVLQQNKLKEAGPKKLMGMMYDAWNNAKGIEIPRKLKTGETYVYDLQGIFDLSANYWLYLILRADYVHPAEFEKVRDQKLTDLGKTNWAKKKVVEYTMNVPQYNELSKVGWLLDETHAKANDAKSIDHHVAAYVMDWDAAQFTA